MNFKKNLKRFMTLNRHHAEGFTLVELIVVIAILAILGGVAVPAYGGYVKKAERANDEALLSAINKAFVSTCMMHGENNFGRKDVNAELNNGSFAYTAPFADTFAGFYEGGTFKVFEGIIYNAKNGMFVEATASALHMYNILKEQYGDEIAALVSSNLGSYGAEGLLTEMGAVVNWANDFGIAGLGGDAFTAAYLGYLGVDISKYDLDNPEDQEKAQAELDAAIERLGGNEEQIMANAVALYAAENTAGVTAEGVLKWLNSEQSTDSMQDSASANTLAEAGAVYGLYMAYAESQGKPFNEENKSTLEVMNDAMGDPAFAAWVNSDEGKAELEAYKASMAIVNGATQDDTAKDSLLTNGFDDPELVGVVESLMGT